MKKIEEVKSFKEQMKGETGQKIQKIGLSIAVLFFVSYCGIYLAERDEKSGYGMVDYGVFYAAGAAVAGTQDLSPNDLYNRPEIVSVINSVRKNSGATRWIYYPAAAVLFAPFSFVVFTASVKLWAFFNSLLFVGGFYLGIRFFEKNIYKFRYSILLVSLAFSYSVYRNIYTGQINTIVWLGILGALWLAWKKRDVLAGLPLAIAVIIKSFPALFAIYFAIRKKWTAAIASFLWGIAISLTALPFFNAEQFIIFFRDILFGEVISEGKVGNVKASASIYGVLVRLREYSPEVFGTEAAVMWADRLFLLSAVGVFTLIIWFFFRYRDNKTTENALLDYGLIMLLAVLFVKGVNDNYAIWTIPLAAYFLRLPFKWKNIPAFLVAILSLVFAQFWNMKPYRLHDENMFAVITPATIGQMALFLVMIIGRENRIARFFGVGIPIRDAQQKELGAKDQERKSVHRRKEHKV